MVSIALRVEWAKCRAQADRWREEVMLIEEEMRRSIEFCWWSTERWRERAKAKSTPCQFLAEGLQAYAFEQVAAEDKRGMQWTILWAEVRRRAREVLKTKLGQVEDAVPLPELVIELDSDEEDPADTGADDEDDG
jgi:hypothetical protein